MIKYFILDTNVILSAGDKVLEGFSSGKDANNVVITGTVLQELDSKKNLMGELGYNARSFIRALDDLREQGDLIKGVPLKKGKVIVEPDGVKSEYLPQGYSLDIADNRIISTCIHLAAKYKRHHYVFVSNDVSCRVNADACFKAADVDIPIQSYMNDRVEKDGEEYQGFAEIEVSDYHIIEKLYKDGICDIPEGSELYECEFVRLTSGTMSALAICFDDMGTLRLKLIKDEETKAYGISPKSFRQAFALYALLSKDIPLVMLTGSAGSGKTFLALAAGLEQVYTDPKEKRYDRIMITRNNAVETGEQLGYMPGTLEDKMAPLLLPYRDSLMSLLRKNSGESADQINMQIEDLFTSGVLEVFSMAYIRGRSIPDSYIIVDEAQNLTQKQIRALLTRPAGENFKCVLCSDLRQIDAPYLDRYSCGMAFALKYMRGSLCAQIHFEDSLRSRLSAIALERLGKHTS